MIGEDQDDKDRKPRKVKPSVVHEWARVSWYGKDDPAIQHEWVKNVVANIRTKNTRVWYCEMLLPCDVVQSQFAGGPDITNWVSVYHVGSDPFELVGKAMIALDMLIKSPEEQSSMISTIAKLVSGAWQDSLIAGFEGKKEAGDE